MRTRPSTAPAATAAAALAVAALVLSACGGTTTEADAGASSAPAAASSAPPAASSAPAGDATPTAGSESSAGGAYVTRAEYDADPAAYSGTTVVYFFHASWCPSCRATEKAIDAEGVPAGLTVVKVDYDSETDLRKTYGVTQQHTFVQVDDAGKELAKWSGSGDGAAILAETV